MNSEAANIELLRLIKDEPDHVLVDFLLLNKDEINYDDFITAVINNRGQKARIIAYYGKINIHENDCFALKLACENELANSVLELSIDINEISLELLNEEMEKIILRNGNKKIYETLAKVKARKEQFQNKKEITMNFNNFCDGLNFTHYEFKESEYYDSLYDEEYSEILIPGMILKTNLEECKYILVGNINEQLGVCNCCTIFSLKNIVGYYNLFKDEKNE
jgi:hypothetical protein